MDGIKYITPVFESIVIGTDEATGEWQNKEHGNGFVDIVNCLDFAGHQTPSSAGTRENTNESESGSDAPWS